MLPLILAAAQGQAANDPARPAAPIVPDRAAMVRYAAESGERIWQAAQQPDLRNPSSRDLFTYALALCEAKLHPERLERLFEVAAQMQDQDSASCGFGNFHWSWAHTKVEDFNAVDFCMQGGALLWLRHRDTMPAATRAKLRAMLSLAVEGLKRHRVREDYTNIALMNAGDLILLGEALGEAAVASEGYTRLDHIVLAIWDHGIHEYDSPTYYGVDLDDLVLIEAFCQRERARAQAQALLELFWTDIALNWFPAGQKLAGTRSRDYDYLRGLGMLDTQLWAAGWLSGKARGSIGAIWPALARWNPPARLRALSETRLPRLVRQKWGASDHAIRTQYLQRDVTLSASGEYYGGWMDLPLTADLPGERESVRCYFIPDGRHDPYGKFKIAAGPHQKTLHLGPFFAGAQRQGDALGLCVYREADVPTNSLSLESHFVMPLNTDGFWIGEQRVELTEKTPLSLPVTAGQALVLRKGTAAVGVRVPWARGMDGRQAAVHFVWDTNHYGAVRLTVDHQLSQAGTRRSNSPRPGAAFWVRTGSGLETEAAFAEWRRAFASAGVRVEANAEQVELRAQGRDGSLAVGTLAPFKTCTLMEPPPERVVLELDGQDLGRRLLNNLEPMKSLAAEEARAQTMAAPPGAPLYWEAESGVVLPAMERGQDASASGGAFVWMPGEPGGKGGAPGSATWRLQIARAGEY
ncbi:MAG: hypothetical protein NTW03_06645, partial [Verrucomicrobia bacterium]|nr:hypothetical protein [Verrucomicrobiota bacterium]